MDSEFYSRQIDVLGEEGQRKISKAKVSIVGAGGLGSFVSSQLVRLGIGTIRLIDSDRVEKSNLHRTAFFETRDIDRPKVRVTELRLGSVNPSSRIETFKDRLCEDNVDILNASDIVIDCTDNMETRFVINDFCTKNDIPWIYASVSGTSGLSSTFKAGGKPCLKCLYPNIKSNDEMVSKKEGILPPIVPALASWQVMECIKIITGIGEPNHEKLLKVDMKDSKFEFIQVNPNPMCKTCVGDE